MQKIKIKNPHTLLCVWGFLIITNQVFLKPCTVYFLSAIAACAAANLAIGTRNGEQDT